MHAHPANRLESVLLALGLSISSFNVDVLPAARQERGCFELEKMIPVG